MDEHGTEGRAEPGQSCRALAVRDGDGGGARADEGATAQRTTSRRVSGGRPMASFLAQLMGSVDPTLRPPRGERTRAAARTYARAARLA